MAIKRYQATKDNTITNALKGDIINRGTGSNMGAADVLEVFSIYGRETAVGVNRTSGSQELTRVLIQFPTTDISSDRTAGTIPASGSVSFYLRIFNAETSTNSVSPLKSSATNSYCIISFLILLIFFSGKSHLFIATIIGTFAAFACLIASTV